MVLALWAFFVLAPNSCGPTLSVPNSFGLNLVTSVVVGHTWLQFLKRISCFPPKHLKVSPTNLKLRWNELLDLGRLANFEIVQAPVVFINSSVIEKSKLYSTLRLESLKGVQLLWILNRLLIFLFTFWINFNIVISWRPIKMYLVLTSQFSASLVRM